MTHIERIKTILEGKKPDRVPVAAWGHFMNLEDRNASDFVNATIDFQNNYQFDILKIMSNSYYLTEDMGNVLRPSKNSEDPAYLCAEKLAIQKPQDWYELRVPDVHKGALAREIEVAKRLVDYYKGTVPILPTIFSPLMWCVYMYWPMDEQFKVQFTGDGLVPHIEQYISAHEDEVSYGLQVVSETNTLLMDEFIKAGVDGFFYSQPYAHTTWSDPELFYKYAKAYDMQALQRISSKTWFNMLHVCGNNHVNMDLVYDYPVEAFNWEDLTPGNPGLSEVRQKTDKILMGGLDRNRDLFSDDRSKIKETVSKRAAYGRNAVGNRFILAAGCSSYGDSIHRFHVMQEALDELKQ